MARTKIADAAQELVLTESARRCALCFGLDGKLDRVRGQLAHIDRDSSNSSAENIAFLCLAHHDEYDSPTSQSKGFTARELTSYRNRLHDAIASGLHHPAPDRASPVRADLVEHDRKAFRAGDAILSERGLRDFLDHVGGDHSYRLRHLDPIADFVEHFRTESARFVISDLLPVLDELLVQLDEVRLFLATHFFVYPDGQPHDDPEGLRCCMYPKHNVDRGGHESEQDSFYGKYSRTLWAILNAVEEAYAEYRRTIKRTLLV